MSIRDQAWQAFTTEQSAAIDEAEAGLRDVLVGLTVELGLVDVSAARGVRTFVFSDGDVHLATYMQDGQRVVKVVAPDPEGWRELSPPVTSLAEVSPYVPPAVEVEPEPWVEGNLYSEGDVVTHDGQTWRSTVDANHWEPGSVHSVWVVA